MNSSYVLQNRLDVINSFADLNYDPFVGIYGEILLGLNNVISKIGEPCEGNLFYKHLETDFGTVVQHFLPKRRALGLAGMMFNNVMEIGFNAGHSALLLLASNPNLKLTSIDLCYHKYTVPCYEYLKSIFGDRINLIQANSLVAFPLLDNVCDGFDFYIIDGGHGIDVAESDLYNVIKHGRKGSVILFDDSDHPPLRVLLDMYLLSGKIISIADANWMIKNNSQMFFINNKN
jgi:hypothetical protein